MSIKREPQRKPEGNVDISTIGDVVYNEAAGARKVIIIEPVVKKAVIATDFYEFGSYVKVTGATYSLDCLGKAYSPTNTYRIGNLVTNGGFVYMANVDGITGVFDATKWNLMSDKLIGPVSISAGSVVSTGKWHNSVSAIGFLVEDPSRFK